MNVVRDIINGEPWFVAQEVAEMLGYAVQTWLFARMQKDRKPQAPRRGCFFVARSIREFQIFRTPFGHDGRK
ncbi:prophage antirepressor-like protein [Paraburkholderia youngii]|nr:hypothetical protein BH160DRAFT_1470 [Burkholderia sp. H160]